MVVKATIKADLNVLYAAAQAGMTDDDFADAMADIIKDAILSAIVQPGITLTTPDTINGATTGTGTLL
jgi:hypothetical protein